MSSKTTAPFACSVLLIGILFGCQPNSNTAVSELDIAPQAGLKLHQPKTFSAAINRLAEINESLLSAAPFPEPLQVDYVEVVHGSGPGGHSHFYLAAAYDANGEEEHGDHHSEEDETVKRLVATIPLKTELPDVVKWLPDLAAESNTSESDWTIASDTAKRLTQILDAIPEDTSDKDFRDAWKQQAKEIEPLLTKLQTLATKYAGESE